jgi:2Fe-2S ferredoxin
MTFEVADQSTLTTVVTMESTVLAVAIRHKIDLNHSCGGNGTCGTCRVFVEADGTRQPRNELEQEMADERGFSESERLACQLQACAQLRVRIPQN